MPRPDLEAKPVASDIPAPVLAGQYDPATPPANGAHMLSIAELPVESGDGVLLHSLRIEEVARLQSLLHQHIADHTPPPYLLGRAWFAGLEFGCDQRAIIPRSPIAELVLGDFRPWRKGPEPSRIPDLCFGGGCIGLAAAHYFAAARVDLLDIDSNALELSRENAKPLGLADRVTICQADLFEGLGEGRGNAQYDLILSNPPYVDAADFSNMPAEYHHEPELALGSGPDGLALTHRILSSARSILRDSGLLVVEAGNSGTTFEEVYPRVPFTWIEFEDCG